MVQKKNRWNISKQKGEEYAHTYILEILKDSKNNTLPLSELVLLLNQRTKHIKLIYHNREKSMSVYLKSIYGSMINFMDNYGFYGVLMNSQDIKIKLLECELNPSDLHTSIQEYKEWILVDEEEFILV
jgi:hypothetical protein